MISNFWQILSNDHPEMVPFLVDWDEEKFVFSSKDICAKELTPLYAYPPVLPINKTSTSFSTEGGYYTITVFL